MMTWQAHRSRHLFIPKRSTCSNETRVSHRINKHHEVVESTPIRHPRIHSQTLHTARHEQFQFRTHPKLHECCLRKYGMDQHLEVLKDPKGSFPQHLGHTALVAVYDPVFSSHRADSRLREGIRDQFRLRP